jgi:hypothetical protein
LPVARSLLYDDQNAHPSDGPLPVALEQARSHPRFFMGDAGRGVMTTSFYDDCFVPFVGDGRCGDGTTGS